VTAVGAAGALAACSGTATSSPTAPSASTQTSTTTIPGTLPPTTVPSTTAKATTTTTVAPEGPAGTKRMHFEFGPIMVEPGQNAIQFTANQVPKPPVDGWLLRIAPNIRRKDGTVPPVDVIHLHHGVWLNLSRPNATGPGPERLFAIGEEKTITQFPPGFGYDYKASDRWAISYMLHNLTPNGEPIWLTYDLDFLPATAPSAAGMRAVRPIWMDVENPSPYPVFDVIKGSGKNGTFTFPDQATNPYNGGPPANVWTVDSDGILVATAGHLHPGGLHDDLWLDRSGSTAHLFDSAAHYFEPAGAVSWDVSMTATKPDWRVAVHKGDQLRINSTYDSSQASWYESMGIMVVWMASGTDGANPFTTPVDGAGVLTHGHLPENNNHGGGPGPLANPTTRPGAPAANPITIAGFEYAAGDMADTGPLPEVKAGQPLNFLNQDAPIGVGIWHTITACKAPCNGATGIAYPIANGPVAFDSGELGDAGAPTAGRVTWSTPTNLPPGVYTYFCRIHPFMRGAFQVTS
jgi:plastocyanin